MVRAAAESLPLPEPILEVGARVIAGQERDAVRPLFPGRKYVGVDIEAGAGVDRVADVERLPFANGSFGTVIALNVFEHTPRFWLGVEEAFRVVRPGGTVVIAWHGGTSPSRIARSLRLPEDELNRIEHVLRDRFGEVSRKQLASLDVFRAVRSG